MRLFGSDRIVGVMEKLGMEENQELQSPFLNRAIERAQKKVEERNFSIRKHTLEFDDVMNKQRSIIYQNRNRILNASSLKEFVLDRIENMIDSGVETFYDGRELDSDGIRSWFRASGPSLPLRTAWTQ
jgi:preprotein translocase subunit SecA